MAPADKTPVTNLQAVLRVPRTVHIIPESRSGQGSYTSVITDFDESAVFLTEPARGPETLPLHPGDTVRAVYYGDDAVYDFSLTVTGRAEGPQGGLRYRAEVPATCWRLQRRDSYRLQVRIEAEYRVRSRPDGSPLAAEPDPTPCLLVDISGGGVSFLTDEALDVDASVELSFSLDSAERSARFSEPIRVVRTGPAPNGLADRYAHRCAGSFSDIDDRARNHILRHIFLEQVDALGKRRG